MFGLYEPGPYSCSYASCSELMPFTSPPKCPVARNDSRYGTLIEKISFDPSSVPTVNTENDAGFSVSYSASAAAIFIGCTSVITLPCRSPLIATPTLATSTTDAPIFSADRNTSLSTQGRRSRCHSATPATKRSEEHTSE